MNREIKFRAWNKKANYMDEDFAIHADGCIYQPCMKRWDISDFAVENAYDDLDIMQYTGLKDKNGKEIYEGDIFKPFSEGIRYYALCFENGCFKLKSNLGTWGTIERFFELAPKYGCDVEVIGNIYENPELLNA